MIFKLANPKRFLKISEFLLPYFSVFFFVLMVYGLYLSFFKSPPDYLQGETVRIMYIHVPCAWFSLMLYSSMALCGFFSLIFRHTLADIAIRAIAPLGASFTIATLITGSIWGKPTWGTWWVWDARLTSELVLLFLYIGVISLSNSFEKKSQGDKYAAILSIVGIINLPIIKWSVDWWNTLHQPASISKFSSPSIDSAMLFPLFVMTFAFLFLSLSIIIIRIKTEILQRKIDILNSAKIN